MPFNVPLTSANQTDRELIGNAPAPGVWSPSPFIRGSFWLHGAALVGAVATPSWWPLYAGALVLDHAVLSAAGLWPRSHLLGPNWTRLPASSAQRNEVALTLDDGPDPGVTPGVLDVLDRYHARATFFCIGQRATHYREIAGEIVRRGHDIENHSERHSHIFAFSAPGAFRKEIAAAQESLAEVSGRYPEFFRAPAGLRNPMLQPVLAHLGLQLAAWTRRGFDTVERDADVVSQRLIKKLGAGDILLLHDGNALMGSNHTPVVLDVLPRVLEALAAQGLNTVTLRQARA